MNNITIEKGIKMNITYHVKDHELAEDFKKISFEKLNTLTHLGLNLESCKVEVTYHESAKIKKANHEVIIGIRYNSYYFRGEGRSSNDLKAFDKAFLAVDKQLRIHHEKIITH